VGARLLRPNLATHNANVVVRNVAHLGVAGAHACECGKTECKPDANGPAYMKSMICDRRTTLLERDAASALNKLAHKIS
jgi:hypothetical protein